MTLSARSCKKCVDKLHQSQLLATNRTSSSGPGELLVYQQWGGVSVGMGERYWLEFGPTSLVANEQYAILVLIWNKNSNQKISAKLCKGRCFCFMTRFNGENYWSVRATISETTNNTWLSSCWHQTKCQSWPCIMRTTVERKEGKGSLRPFHFRVSFPRLVFAMPRYKGKSNADFVIRLAGCTVSVDFISSLMITIWMPLLHDNRCVLYLLVSGEQHL